MAVNNLAFLLKFCKIDDSPTLNKLILPLILVFCGIIEKKGNVATSKLNILKEMIFMGKAVTILTYDYLSFSKYNNDLNTEEKFIFLRFIRNGAAHYNKFNLKDERGYWKLTENEVIQWRDKKITRHLHNSTVFNDFISLFEIFLLAKFFSEKLISIDNLKNKLSL